MGGLYCLRSLTVRPKLSANPSMYRGSVYPLAMHRSVFALARLIPASALAIPLGGLATGLGASHLARATICA